MTQPEINQLAQLLAKFISELLPADKPQQIKPAKPTATKEISDWYSVLGKRGVAGRLARIPKEERQAIARAGGLASQAKRKAAQQQSMF